MLSNLHEVLRGDVGRGLSEARLWLGSHGVDINCTDASGKTTAFLAAQAGCTSILGTLISHGADVNKRDHLGTSPLAAACAGAHAGCFDLIFPLVTNLANESEALRASVAGGLIGYVQSLIDGGADPTVVCQQTGASAVSLAAASGSDDCLGALLRSYHSVPFIRKVRHLP